MKLLLSEVDCLFKSCKPCWSTAALLVVAVAWNVCKINPITHLGSKNLLLFGPFRLKKCLSGNQSLLEVDKEPCLSFLFLLSLLLFGLPSSLFAPLLLSFLLFLLESFVLVFVLVFFNFSFLFPLLLPHLLLISSSPPFPHFFLQDFTC